MTMIMAWDHTTFLFFFKVVLKNCHSQFVVIYGLKPDMESLN